MLVLVAFKEFFIILYILISIIMIGLSLRMYEVGQIKFRGLILIAIVLLPGLIFWLALTILGMLYSLLFWVMTGRNLLKEIYKRY